MVGGGDNTRSPTGGGPSLDTTGAGAPFIPAQSSGSHVSGASSPADVPPSEDLVVEVEFAPGAAGLASALSGNVAGFMANLGGAAPNSGLGAVLSEFGVRDARQVFSSGQIQADEARTAALRAAAASGVASPEQAGTLERLPPLASFVRLRFPPGTPPSKVTAALGRLPEVTRAVPVPKAAPPTLAAAAPLPSDPLIGPFPEPVSPDPNTGLEWQWYLHRTRVPQAWRFARGTDVVLADIDWGFRTSHQDLRSAVRRTYNAVDGGSDVTQGANAAHGTAVLGLAGARGDSAGMAGIAPEAELWAIQGDSGPGQRVFEEPWAEALDFVRRSDSGGRRKVVILEVQTVSGGNYEQVPSIHRAIRAAIADGCIVCVAAGNGNRPADRTDIEGSDRSPSALYRGTVP
ncbi:S8 family serine peptidase [Microvirga sp. VF16]|uniref:S8 family serine peptidase n=1 Tax=Microvirga sp. VF16 TaxID=2807101 RepID=UPI00193E985B|nr:S8 family serine peptidase [Microvirga sp. VF16]QRM35408.1 S8 family serine peptidase [Microvirga sp. VF16]